MWPECGNNKARKCDPKGVARVSQGGRKGVASVAKKVNNP